jgi:hypothetical protein
MAMSRWCREGRSVGREEVCLHRDGEIGGTWLFQTRACYGVELIRGSGIECERVR